MFVAIEKWNISKITDYESGADMPLIPSPNTYYFQNITAVYTVTWQLKGWNNGVRRNCPLLRNGSINTYRGRGYSRRAVRGGVFYAVCSESV
jgi:hypothetical protein